MSDLNPHPFDGRLALILSAWQTFERDLWEQLYGILAQCGCSSPGWEAVQFSSSDELVRVFLSHWGDLPDRARWYAVYFINHASRQKQAQIDYEN